MVVFGAETDPFAVVPRVEHFAHILFEPLVRLAFEMEFAFCHALGKPLHLGGIRVDVPAQRRHLLRGRGVKPDAVAEGGGGELKPEHGAVVPIFARPEREPEVVLVRPAAEEPPRVAVDARNVEAVRLVRVLLAHKRERFLCKRVERLLYRAQKLLLMRFKPRLFVVEREFPEKFSGLARKSGKRHKMTSRWKAPGRSPRRLDFGKYGDQALPSQPSTSTILWRTMS